LKHKIAALIILSITFFLALAVMDYIIMHGYGAQNSSEWQYPLWLYKYWMALGIVVVVFASCVAYILYAFNAPKRFIIASFITIILLFVGGFLDLFYFVISSIRGEPYGFDIWSAQYKWFGSWNWSQQIAWTLTCLLCICLIWWRALKR